MNFLGKVKKYTRVDKDASGALVSCSYVRKDASGNVISSGTWPA